MKELSEYLRDLYPESSDEMINYYIHLIEDSEQEKLPPTKEMLEFAKLKNQIAKLEQQLEDLKKTIIEQKERIGHNFQIININKSSRRIWHTDKVYEWAAGMLDPETLESITVKTIDEKKFMKLEAKGIISYDSIPETCYTYSDPSYTVSVSRSKEAKNKLSGLSDE